MVYAMLTASGLFTTWNMSLKLKKKHMLVQHKKAETFLDILKSFFRPTLVRV